jgi:endonuclease/exonuclease/phosphatase (EEP) superfamily protein YafD
MFTSADRYHPISDVNALRKLGNASAIDFGPSIKMISWNMFKARRRGWLLDLETLTAGVELVLLQEAVLRGGLAHPFHLASGLEWIMAENLRSNGGHTTTGPKTGSRVKALESRAIRSQDREPVVATPKTLLVTTYPFANSILLVVNVHAVNFVTVSKFARQVEQIVEPLSAHDGPCIVAGDFNTWNEARWHILQEAMRSSAMTRVPAQFPRLRHLNRVLDHVFYRDLRLMTSRALPHVKSSDHVPLWAEFSAL